MSRKEIMENLLMVLKDQEVCLERYVQTGDVFWLKSFKSWTHSAFMWSSYLD